MADGMDGGFMVIDWQATVNVKPEVDEMPQLSTAVTVKTWVPPGRALLIETTPVSRLTLATPVYVGEVALKLTIDPLSDGTRSGVTEVFPRIDTLEFG